MNCPHCASALTKEQTKKTALGYRTFRCSACKQAFNERTSTPFNFLEYPTDIVLLVVLRRLRYKLSLRDLAEMFLERGWEFTHETVREWETRFAPFIAEQPQGKRRGRLNGKDGLTAGVAESRRRQISSTGEGSWPDEPRARKRRMR